MSYETVSTAKSKLINRNSFSTTSNDIRKAGFLCKLQEGLQENMVPQSRDIFVKVVKII